MAQGLWGALLRVSLTLLGLHVIAFWLLEWGTAAFYVWVLSLTLVLATTIGLFAVLRADWRPFEHEDWREPE